MERGSNMSAIARMSVKAWRLGLLVLCWPLAAAAAPVEAVALFKDRVVVRSPAGQEMIRVGQTSAGGVTLLEADTRGARVKGVGFKVETERREPGKFVRELLQGWRIVNQFFVDQ